MNQKLAIQKLSQLIDKNHSKEIAEDCRLLKLNSNQDYINAIVKKYNLKNLQ